MANWWAKNIAGPVGLFFNPAVKKGMGAAQGAFNQARGAPALPWDQTADPQAVAAQRANPVLQALNAQQAAETPLLARNTFAGYADRGFWGDQATRGVGEQLGKMQGGFEMQRQQALTNALQGVTNERLQRGQMGIMQQQADAQKEAAKPWWQKLFG